MVAASQAHLNASAVAVLLFKGDKALVHVLRLRARDVVQCVLEDGPRALALLALLLKLRKLDEQLLLQPTSAPQTS